MSRDVCRCVLVVAVLVLGGCWPENYREDADREVYHIVGQKSESVPGMPSEFTIDQAEGGHLQSLPEVEPPSLEKIAPEMGSEQAASPAPGDEQAAPEETAPQAPDRQQDASSGTSASAGTGSAPQQSEQSAGGENGEKAVMISLPDALGIAAANSRELQSRREQVYTSALALTLERYRFDPQWTGTISGRYNNDQTDERVTGNTNLGFNWLLSTGANISVGLASNFVEFLTGDPRKAAASTLDISVVQPLLRGAGRDTTEPLTQAERDVVYSLREFVRFRRTFFVGVASEYYGVLEQLQRVENQQQNYKSLKDSLERNRALAEAGQMAGYQVDQIEQQVLSAEDRLKSAWDSYERALDRFKLTLALSAEADIALDREALKELEQVEVALELPSRRAAVQAALENRLDLRTARDRVEDAQRKIKVAEDNLQSDVDLVLRSSTPTDDEANKPLDLQAGDTEYTAGLDVDLPLDRKSERNTYRRRLIDLASQLRSYRRLRDQLVLDVRDSLRRFYRAMSSYEIQKESLALAQRRVEMNRILLQAGRAIPRDLLEAEADLLEARNAVTEELVNYRIARLELARDMDILKVGKKGSLEENFDAVQSTQ